METQSNSTIFSTAHLYSQFLDVRPDRIVQSLTINEVYSWHSALKRHAPTREMTLLMGNQQETIARQLAVRIAMAKTSSVVSIESLEDSFYSGDTVFRFPTSPGDPTVIVTSNNVIGATPHAGVYDMSPGGMTHNERAIFNSTAELMGLAAYDPQEDRDIESDYDDDQSIPVIAPVIGAFRSLSVAPIDNGQAALEACAEDYDLDIVIGSQTPTSSDSSYSVISASRDDDTFMSDYLVGRMTASSIPPPQRVNGEAFKRDLRLAIDAAALTDVLNRSPNHMDGVPLPSGARADLNMLQDFSDPGADAYIVSGGSMALYHALYANIRVNAGKPVLLVCLDSNLKTRGMLLDDNLDIVDYGHSLLVTGVRKDTFWVTDTFPYFSKDVVSARVSFADPDDPAGILVEYEGRCGPINPQQVKLTSLMESYTYFQVYVPFEACGSNLTAVSGTVDGNYDWSDRYSLSVSSHKGIVILSNHLLHQFRHAHVLTGVYYMHMHAVRYRRSLEISRAFDFFFPRSISCSFGAEDTVHQLMYSTGKGYATIIKHIGGPSMRMLLKELYGT